MNQKEIVPTWRSPSVTTGPEVTLDLDDPVGRVEYLRVDLVEAHLYGGARPLHVVRRVVTGNDDDPDADLRHPVGRYSHGRRRRRATSGSDAERHGRIGRRLSRHTVRKAHEGHCGHGQGQGKFEGHWEVSWIGYGPRWGPGGPFC